MSQTIEQRRLQFHTSCVGEFLDRLNPQVNSFLEQCRDFFNQQSGDSAASQQMAVQALENLRQQQALSPAYFDIFWVAVILALGLVPLVLLMKGSVAGKGSRIAAE